MTETLVKQVPACQPARPFARFRLVRAGASLLSSGAALFVALGAARADDGWRWVKERNGATLERRAVDGSPFFEYRVRGRAPVAPDLALARLWAGIGDERSPGLKRRTVLRKSEDQMVVHDEVRAPVVSDRDVVIELRKRAVAPGTFEVAFQSIDTGPPPAPGIVRLPVVRGEWIIGPDGSGGAALSYRCYSEPGGAIPAFMVRGTLQEQALDEYDRVLSRVQR